MRKRRGNFWQKVMAVLLAAVLCAGLTAGTGAVDAWAAEETQTAWFRAAFPDYIGTPTGIFTVYLTDDNNKKYDPVVGVQDGIVSYAVTGLSRNHNYYWLVDGNRVASFNNNEPAYTIEKTYYSVNYMDGSSLLNKKYVEFDTKAIRPVPDPTKPGYTFAGWRTVYGGKEEFPFDTRNITDTTNIYAAWRRTVTDPALDTELWNALVSLAVTNSTTDGDVRKEIKAQIDSSFDIDSTVTVTVFEPVYAVSGMAGTLKLDVSVIYNEFSARKEITKTIPMLPTLGERGWSLDSAGVLVIISQAGMEDWAINGKTDNKELVKEVQIMDGVIRIPDNAFSGCGGLGAVSIPESVTEIGNSAFAGASSLGGITLPSNLQSIEDGAFSGCTSLEKVVMQGSTPPAMGSSVFDDCKFTTDSTGMGGIIVPQGSGDAYKNLGGVFGTHVKEEAEAGITEETLGDRLQKILDNLSVSNSTTREEVRDQVKRSLDGFLQIDSVITVSSFNLVYATFENEGFLELTVSAGSGNVLAERSARIPISRLPLPPQDKGWTLDGAGNLIITGQAGMEDWVQNGRGESNLSDVKHVLIQDGVITIPPHTFSGCDNLTSVSVPGTVTDIGDSAFAGAVSLEKVEMQGVTPPTVGSGVFDDCKFVTDSVGGILVPPGSGDAYKQGLGGTLGAFVTEGSLTVTEEALQNKLQQILANLSVSNDTTMEEVRITIKKEIDQYFQIDCTITVAGFTLEEATTEGEGSLKLAVVAGHGGISVSAEEAVPIPQLPPLPDRGWTLDQAGNLTITNQAGMEDWAQNGRAEGNFPKVKNILIGSGVTAIPEDAFSGCADLIAVVLPDTVVSIGNQAFANAFSLGEITLPPGLQGIGDNAFMNCGNLGKVVMQGTTPPSLGSSVFDQSKFMTDSSKGIVVPSGSEDAYKAAWGALGDYILEKHTHSFEADWKYDEMSHWHECACGGKGSMSSHGWGNGVIVKAPTATEAGFMEYSCSLCPAVKTETIPATGTDPSAPGDDSSGTGNNPGGDGSVSGNNPGGDPSVSGNNPGGNPSVSDNNPGGNPSEPGGNPGSNPSESGGNSGSNPSGPGSNPGDNSSGSGNGNSDGGGSSDGGGGLPLTETAGDWSLLDTLTPNNSRDREPRTADGVPLELYATIAMIAGFFYLILLFLDRYDITEEERRESLARLVRWAKRGGWLRRLPVMAALYTMRLYYRVIDGQASKGRKI